VTLYVLRHGVAEEARAGRDDRARRLTPAGRAKMRRAAAGLRALGIDLDALLTSPYPRAAETAALVAEAWEGTVAPQEVAALAAGVPAAETLRALRPWARRGGVMVVGHEPGLGELAALVLSGSATGLTVPLKKGGCVAIDAEQLVPPAGARLRWMLTPRQLRRLARA
jgi:phosphohistidine phosphatase